jgi:hypothetical protein
LVVAPKLANEIDRFRPTGEEAVGAEIDRSIGEVGRRE